MCVCVCQWVHAFVGACACVKLLCECLTVHKSSVCVYGYSKRLQLGQSVRQVK